MNEAANKTKQVIAKNLLYFMELNNKTRKDICRELDIKYTTFCDWVNAKAYPRIEALEKMAFYFNVEVGDFFIDIDFDRAGDGDNKRIMSYMSKMGVIDLDVIGKLSDEQIKILLKSGVSIKKKSLEDFVKESGAKKIVASDELVWGAATGDELW